MIQFKRIYLKLIISGCKSISTLMQIENQGKKKLCYLALQT